MWGPVKPGENQIRGHHQDTQKQNESHSSSIVCPQPLQRTSCRPIRECRSRGWMDRLGTAQMIRWRFLGSGDSCHGFQPIGSGVGIDYSHVGDEPIATFWKSLDIARAFRRITECAAELSDCNVDCLVEVAERFLGSKTGPQLFPSDNFPRM